MSGQSRFLEGSFAPVAEESGSLVRWLLDNQLVEEITLLVCPVIVGQGTRLFPRHRPGHSA